MAGADPVAGERIQLCEMAGCGNRAQGYVEAQWTIVDFVKYEVCVVHRGQIIAALGRRRIDGELPYGVQYTSYWDW